MRKFLYPLILSLLLFFHGVDANSQSHWSEVYSNIIYPYSNADVNALASGPSGNTIYAGIGNKVYKWDGNYWTELGTGSNALNVNSLIQTITTDPAGNVYAGGWFTNQAGKNYVAKWNGSTWTELGSGSNPFIGGGFLKSIISDAAGNMYVAGAFRNSLGKIFVAKWDGSTWSELGGLGAFNVNEYVATLAIDASGNIYAGGHFVNGSGMRYVTKWNGTTWSEMGIGANGLNANSTINSITVDVAGNVYAAGQFTNSSNKSYVAKWTGTNWTEVGTGANALNGNASIASIISDAVGNLYAAGSFSNATNQYVAKWNGTSWSQLGNFNASHPIYCLAKDASGNIYAGGTFVNGIGYRYVSKWTATSNTWGEINSGGIGTFDAGNSYVIAMATDAAGNIYAAPYYNGASVSRWNGNVWTVLGYESPATSLNSNGHIHTIAVDASGNVYAAGNFYIGFNNRRYVAKWDGTTWSELGTGANALNANSDINSIAIDATGNVYAAGHFLTPSGKRGVMKWNGTTWSEVGPGPNALNSGEPIYRIKLDPFGNLYANAYRDAGDVHYIAKWDGTTWSQVGAGTTSYQPDELNGVMTFDNAGNLYAQDTRVINGNFVTYVAKWNGTIWTPFAGVTDNIGKGNYYMTDHAGNLYFGGVPFDHNARIDKWDGTNFTKLGDFLPTDDAYVTVVTPNSKIYAGGKFTRNGRNCGVTLYDPLYLPIPDVINISAKCTGDATAKAKLRNPPANGTIAITQDGLPLTYSHADSSFTYFINGVTTAGNHLISVKYTNSQNNTQKDSLYTVSNSVVPTILINGNLTVTQGQSTALTLNTTNEGTSPLYQWQDSTSVAGWVNIPGGTGNTLNYSPTVTGNKLRCRITSNAVCAVPQTVTSVSVVFTVNFITAVSSVPSNQYGIRIFPNPATITINIDSLKLSDKWQTITLQSFDGKKVFAEQSINNRTGFSQSIATLKSGIYIIILRRKNGTAAYFKLVKL